MRYVLSSSRQRASSPGMSSWVARPCTLRRGCSARVLPLSPSLPPPLFRGMGRATTQWLEGMKSLPLWDEPCLCTLRICCSNAQGQYRLTSSVGQSRQYGGTRSPGHGRLLSRPAAQSSGQIRHSQLGKYPGLGYPDPQGSPQGQEVGRDASEPPPPPLCLPPFAVIMIDTAALADMVAAAVEQGEPCYHMFKRGPGL